ncbi:MAG: hypothetical protein ABI618_11160 [Nitrospirota bacterium]
MMDSSISLETPAHCQHFLKMLVHFWHPQEKENQLSGKQDYSQAGLSKSIAHAREIYPVTSHGISNMPNIKAKLTLSLIS